MGQDEPRTARICWNANAQIGLESFYRFGLNWPKRNSQMLKKLLQKKASKDRIRQAVEHQDVQRGQAEAKARAQDVLKRLEEKKRRAQASNSSTD